MANEHNKKEQLKQRAAATSSLARGRAEVWFDVREPIAIAIHLNRTVVLGYEIPEKRVSP